VISVAKKDRPILVKTDFTTPEKIAERKALDREVEEAQRIEQERLYREADEKRKKDEETRKENLKILYGQKKPQPPEMFKPSRLISVDTDMTVMSMDETLASVKETVEHVEKQLDELSDFVYRQDKKKHASFEMKKLKRKVQRN
jgi:hypothetical protein